MYCRHTRSRTRAVYGMLFEFLSNQTVKHTAQDYKSDFIRPEATDILVLCRGRLEMRAHDCDVSVCTERTKDSEVIMSHPDKARTRSDQAKKNCDGYLPGRNSPEMPIFLHRRYCLINWQEPSLVGNEPRSTRDVRMNASMPIRLSKDARRRILYWQYRLRDPNQIEKRLRQRFGQALFAALVMSPDSESAQSRAKGLNYYRDGEPCGSRHPASTTILTGRNSVIALGAQREAPFIVSENMVGQG